MIRDGLPRGLFDYMFSANVEITQQNEMMDYDDEYDEYCEEDDDDEDDEELGQIYCPQPNCYSFSFINIGGSFFECEDCGTIYNLDVDDLPYISNEEIENAENN